DTGESRLVYQPGRRKRSHPTGVRALIVIKDTFVILRWYDHFVVSAICKNHHRSLATYQTLFQKETRARIAKDSLHHHLVDGFIKLGLVRDYPNTFSGCQTIRLDDDRELKSTDRALCGIRRIARFEARGRNRMPSRELFGEDLAAFETRGCRRWADEPKSA